VIKSKKEMQEWIDCEAKNFVKKFPYSLISQPRRYQILLRKTEYYRNCRKDPFGKLMYYIYRMRLEHTARSTSQLIYQQTYYIYRMRLEHTGQILGISVPCNSCGKGLYLVHYGSVTINQKSVIGENCRIYNNVVIGTLGAGYGEGKCPVIGNNVFIGSNACILGGVKVGDNAVIGAGAIVIKDVPADCTVAGVPARIIKSNNK